VICLCWVQVVVEVEKIVMQERIVEVPVERVVERVIIKEVEVCMCACVRVCMCVCVCVCVCLRTL